MRESQIARIKVVHPYAWLWEPLEGEDTFMLRSMFGSKAVYLDGKLLLCFFAKSEPWRGLLICTAREDHASLISDVPALKPHKILGKWLYLPEAREDFDRVAEKIIRLTLRRDSRIGVIPKPRKRKPTLKKMIP
ncbi:MAG: hypothetical protein ABI254_05230 [Chthoniobacterales bacterium]